MLLSFGNMEKVILSILIFVCHTHQRPQLEVDVLTTTEPTDTTTEETKSSEKISQVTEATAVSVQTSVNFSSFSPSAVFEDFKPSNYYRPDGNPIFERPSPQVSHEVFHKPEYFARPNNQANKLPTKSKDNNVIFPQATQEHYSQYSQFDNRSNGPESRGPYKFTEALPQHQFKPMKHDFGGELPSSAYDNNFYERHFGKYHGNEMSQYPDIIHEPPKIYHSVTTARKKDPWRSMLKVLATILPVGLLLASFPPTVIKVNSTQYPYQFQKNSTAYNTNVIAGRYKALREISTEWKIDGGDKSPGYLDNCLKKKICETIKSNYSHSQLETLQQNYKPNWTTDNGPTMVEIAKAAASAESESCQVFVCSD
ncbi:uncharacterized protein LOC100574016 [Acyrthosiphon pisum]|uniref:Uncharacterized protein n=1 Tax=Acyrthosiphon pisum TaxID=7029 RepID=A0A8R2H9Z9_ACYPI|nr:uncharacterized protein LOC100574016 [Acyrthosiphon pisum]|eukprot:XP_016663153.1 PREDICTED: uncharacterized protein LOC100574016 [Acyrthosiphon pisum]